MTRPRRELGLAVLGCLLGAVVALVAVGRPWLEVAVRRTATLPDRPEGFLVVTKALTGRTLAPAAGAWSLVALAGVVAIAATRRIGRMLTGALLFAAGATVGGLALRVRSDPLAYATDALGPAGVLDARVVPTGWTLVAAAAGALLAGTGLLVFARGGGWAVLSARYARRAEPPPAAAMDDAALWDALDRGDDPA